jgi:hypothetical protein
MNVVALILSTVIDFYWIQEVTGICCSLLHISFVPQVEAQVEAQAEHSQHVPSLHITIGPLLSALASRHALHILSPKLIG